MAVKFDWNILDALMQFKVTKAFVADYMGVSEKTVERKIKSQFKMTFVEYNNLKMSRTGYKLQQKAIEMALNGNTSMMIFALKNLAKWSDKMEEDISGEVSVTVKNFKMDNGN